MRALVLARNTYREVIRDKVLLGVTGFGVGVLLLLRGLSPLVLGEELRLGVDVGLTAVSAFGLLVVLLVGGNLVAKEIERRTLYSILARPLPRHVYLVGKWLGLSAALGSVAALLGAGVEVLVASSGGRQHVLPVAAAVYMAMLELAVMAALAVLFSALSTPVLSALYTLAFYCAGQWCYDLRAFAGHFPEPAGTVAGGVASLVPNLPLFNVRGIAAAGSLPSAEHLAVATLYALLYAAGALGLAALAFERRDLK